MKTRKQVLTDFYEMQKQLFADKRIGSVSLKTYNDDAVEYWCVEMLACHWNLATGKHDLWECVEWTHHSYYTEEDEQKNQLALAEFKEKFNLK